MNQTSINTYRWLYLFIFLAILVNFSGLFTTIIGPDGTMYATIAKTMALKHDYINMYVLNRNWLDKPHFPFWVTALFFNVFGIHTWSYKLPGILFMMMGTVYTFIFARRLYNKEIALWAVLILLTAEHIVLSNSDVRAEAYLTGLIIASVYHFYRSYHPVNYWHLVVGCVFAACSIMTKGMFAIIPIGGAIGGHLLIRKDWNCLFRWRWLIAIMLTLILILPELYCLYEQFDLHPEKVVFGQKGVSGIRWFFWDSQFGRFFNTGPIKGSGDPSFFIHTTLWAFLPWSLLLFAAVFQFIRKGIKRTNAYEWYCISGSILTFLVFSASKFQLPYYLNIVYPFFAIITAQYLYNLRSVKSIRAVRIVQVVLLVIIVLVIGMLQYFFRPGALNWITVMLLAILFIALLFLPRFVSQGFLWRLGISSVLVSFTVNVYLNMAFYPSLLRYQALSEAALWIDQHNAAKLPVAQSGDVPFAMEFYLDQPLYDINVNGTGPLPARPFYLLTTKQILNNLKAKGWQVQPVKTFPRFWISRLTPAFLNSATRDKELTYSQLVIVK
ncbi:MAG: glycosyltransferase family 39 protein [Bacteroidetes bacterium]|nr:glycosyltransferase family 39 protein [Bacteroidota bacterium]